MMIKTRRWLGAALCVLATTIAGCEASTPEASKNKSDVSLRVIVYTANPDQLALLKSLADDFMKVNTEVKKVTFESIAAADLDTKLTAELQTSEAPDASWMTVVNSRRYIKSGALVNLAPTLQSAEGYKFDDLIPSLQKPWVDGDAQYGAPFSTSTQVLYYNADIFRAAGLPTPDKMIANGTWDWDNFRKAAAKISASEHVPAFTPDFTNIELTYPLMYAYKASPWNDTADTCTMDSREMAAAMTLLHDMMYTDKSTSLPGQTATVFDGSAATSVAYLSSISLLKNAKFEWGVVPTPAGPSGSQPTVGQSAYVAFKKGKNPDLAAKLIAHITNPSNAQKLAAFWVPSRASLLTAAKLHESQPLLSEAQFAPIVKGTIENGKIVPVSNNGGAAQSVLLSSLNEHLFARDAVVDNAMKSVCVDLQPSLKSR